MTVVQLGVDNIENSQSRDCTHDEIVWDVCCLSTCVDLIHILNAM